MNKERLQAIIDRIEADPISWNQKSWDYRNSPRLAFYTQIDAGLQLDPFNARRDARIWLDLSNKQANYLLSSYRTWKEIKDFVVNRNYGGDGYDRDGYDCVGYDRDGQDRDSHDRFGPNRAGFNRDGYDCDGLDKHNKPKVEQV